MSNTYQKPGHRAGAAPRDAGITVPDQVLVSMTEIAGAAKEGLLALAVGTGLQVGRHVRPGCHAAVRAGRQAQC